MAIDGNNNALRHSNLIVERFKLQCSFQIKYNIGPIAINDCNDLQILDEIIQDKFDFIISFKAICELISKKRFQVNAYKYIAEILAPKLSDNALMMLLDVTLKNDAIGTFYPIYMNNGLNEFIKNSGTYKTLIPLSCNKYEHICTQECFTQRIFWVTHSRKVNDISKVSYRIIGRKEFVDSIQPLKQKGKFITQIKNGVNIYCPLSEGNMKINTFNIND